MNLSQQNHHIRDDLIHFIEESHTYFVDTDLESKYTSVTKIIHSLFEQFDADKVIAKMMKGRNWNPSNIYWGKTPDEIKDGWTFKGLLASTAGTKMHNQIETFMNNATLLKGYSHEDLLEAYVPVEPVEKEWEHFIRFVTKTLTLKPYRSEWMVFNEDYKISGCIDMVYENEDGTLSIYDWKRCKDIIKKNNFNKSSTILDHIPDTNFWHYSLQLNLYKYILESKYDKKVTQLFLVRLHPESSNYELIEVPVLQNETNTIINSHVSTISRPDV